VRITTPTIVLFFLALSALLFIPFLGNVHLFDWDEINFAEAAREMIVTGDYLRVQIDHAPFWEKPPLFIWLQAISMNVFGINEFAARLPNALIGIATILLLFWTGNTFFDRKVAIFWASVYIASLLPHFYFKSGIIDPLFNLCIFSSLVVYGYYHRKMKESQNKPYQLIALMGAMCGLAVLTKGPVGYLLVILSFSIVSIWRIIKKEYTIIDFLIEGSIATVATIAVCSVWYGTEILVNGPWFMEQFLQYQIRLLTTGDAGHSGPFFYHAVVLLIGCFPASIFFFSSLRIKGKEELTETQTLFHRCMFVLFFVVLILFSIVKTKIVHYSSMAYFPITFFAALSLAKLVDKKIDWKTHYTWLLFTVGLLLTTLFALLPLIGMNAEWIQQYVRDRFAKENLNAFVHWSGWEFSISIVFLATIISTYIYVKQKKMFQAVGLLLIGSTVSIALFLPLMAPNIEGYSQRAAIEFFESVKDSNCYVEVYGYKSYADLFYTQKKKWQTTSPNFQKTALTFEQWLLFGEIDRPVYFVSKVTNTDLFAVPGMKLQYSKNGFLFFKRMPPIPLSKIP
jgi:4-amino-4-deoxy-L-arabinose transferase-like glycosyltransferase